MMAISLRRANTVKRIVLEMMNNVAAAKKAINTIPPILINLRNTEEFFYNILTIMCTFYALECRS